MTLLKKTILCQCYHFYGALDQDTVHQHWHVASLQWAHFVSWFVEFRLKFQSEAWWGFHPELIYNHATIICKFSSQTNQICFQDSIGSEHGTIRCRGLFKSVQVYCNSICRAIKEKTDCHTICKFRRLKQIIMGNNRTLCNNDVTIDNNNAILGAYSLHNR